MNRMFTPLESLLLSNGVKMKLASGSPHLWMAAGGKLFYFLRLKDSLYFLAARQYSVLKPNQACRQELHNQDDKYP
jgi:hypothetical protein